jgi:hypothetical protein
LGYPGDPVVPRKSKVEEKGLGQKVIDLGIVKGMSVPAVQERIMEEDDVFLSPDSIRNYLDKVPDDVVERADQERQNAIVEPIIEYKGEIRELFSQVEELKSTTLDDLKGETPSDSDILAFLVNECGLDEDEAADVLQMVRSQLGDDLKNFFKAVSELRRIIKLAAEFDQELQPARRQTPQEVNVDNMNVVTGEDMLEAFEEAQHDGDTVDV